MTIHSYQQAKQASAYQRRSHTTEQSHWQVMATRIRSWVEHYRAHHIARHNSVVARRFRGIDRKRC